MAKTGVRRSPAVALRWAVEIVAMAIFFVAVYEVVVAGALVLWPNLTDSWILLLWITAATISGLGLSWLHRLVGGGIRRMWPASAGPSPALATLIAATESAGRTDEVLDEVASLLVAGTSADSAEVWVADPDGELRFATSWPDSLARSEVVTHQAPVADADGQLGALVLRADPRRGLTSADERLAADVANSVALLFRNRGLAAELETALDAEREQTENLARSRRRLILARDVARQQLSAEIKLRVDEPLAGCADEVDDLIGDPATDAEHRREILDRLTTRVDTAVADFREVVHGFYPAALNDHGLAPSIGNLVAELPWPASCAATELPRLDQQVEAGVYFCVATLVGHLRGRPPRAGQQLTVDLGLEEDRLSVTMVVSADTGDPVELDADEWEAIADRVNALAATSEITTEPGELRVRITMPVLQARS
jgi:signal transduction histidine kinase